MARHARTGYCILLSLRIAKYGLVFDDIMYGVKSITPVIQDEILPTEGGTSTAFRSKIILIDLTAQRGDHDGFDGVHAVLGFIEDDRSL